MTMFFEQIAVRNFGPYYGLQTLYFGNKLPVVVVHGENMRGKTSLVNAIRWVLYGRALDRFGKPMSMAKLVNQDAAADRDWTLSARLNFRVDKDYYELTRRIQPKDPSVSPTVDSDFEEKLYLEKNGYQLGGEAVQTEINRILPEEISFFFLFDGEMLNRYETLLSSSDKQAQLVKESIERILGVPALTNAISDLRINLKEAAKRQQNLAKKDKAAQVYATIAGNLESDIETLEEDLKSLKEEREDRMRRQKELDERLQATAAIEADVQRLQSLDAQISQLVGEEKRLLKEKRDLLATAWRDLVQPAIAKRLDELDTVRTVHRNGFAKATALKAQVEQLSALLESKICPLCGHVHTFNDTMDLSDRKTKLAAELDALNFDEDQWSQAEESMRRLRKVTPAGVAQTLRSIESRLLTIRVDLVDLEQQKRDANERLKTHDAAAIARNRRDYEEVTKDLGILEAAIDDKDGEIGLTQAQARQNRAKISQFAGPELERLNREVQLYEALLALYERAIDRLRDELKQAVEKDASAIFRDLTTEQTYQGLRINNSYGLTILDSQGCDVPVRSAGAEQVVALSLIGALNRNAVRRGPIIMDTPFGRLDMEHRQNILRFIPTMSQQVTLLVHGGEVDAGSQLDPIRDRIDKEYRIERVSSSRSRLELVKEA